MNLLFTFKDDSNQMEDDSIIDILDALHNSFDDLESSFLQASNFFQIFILKKQISKI
jgi:hypothetical protein